MIYEAVAQGKRVVTIHSRDLAPVRAWLWAHGYTYKANKNDNVLELLIEKR